MVAKLNMIFVGRPETGHFKLNNVSEDENNKANNSLLRDNFLLLKVG